MMANTDTTKKTMRAWGIDGYGGPERLKLMELPVPEPQPGDTPYRPPRHADPDPHSQCGSGP